MRDRALAPPPTHALALGGQKEMLDRRRGELERWMWRLIGRPEVARSGAVKGFLVFDKALARAQQVQQQAQQQAQRCGGGRCRERRAGGGGSLAVGWLACALWGTGSGGRCAGPLLWEGWGLAAVGVVV